jgi:hypothetical protein
MQLMSPLMLVLVFVATAIVTLIAFKAGLRLGQWRSQQPDPEPQLFVRTLVASILSLLAFILGFTFGLASSHFDSRSQSVFDEAIAIRTAYDRAEFLPGPERTSIRRLLLEYVDFRLDARRSPQLASVEQLRDLQKKIWAQAVIAGKNNTQPSMNPLIDSIINLIDVHAERVVDGFRSRIPLQVWFILYGMTVVSVATAGYLAGLSGARRSIAAVAYALVFSSVIVLIAAGDIPGPQQFQTSHQALIDLRGRLDVP